jgi:serine/threonine-protein kinase HipA
MRVLAVLLAGRAAGVLSQGLNGVLELTYDDVYRGQPRALPLSLSLPLADESHRGPVVRAFCQGLLPDNETVLERAGIRLA